MVSQPSRDRPAPWLASLRDQGADGTPAHEVEGMGDEGVHALLGDRELHDGALGGREVDGLAAPPAGVALDERDALLDHRVEDRANDVKRVHLVGPDWRRTGACRVRRSTRRSLRIKLQNDYRRPRFIATVPRLGYRFVPTFSNRGWAHEESPGPHPRNWASAGPARQGWLC